MANIALLIYDVTDAQGTILKGHIETEGGHTVTLVDDADIDTHDFSGYDVLVGHMMTTSDAVAASLRALVDTDGIPLLLSLASTGPGVGSGNNLIPTRMHLCGTIYWYDFPSGVNYVNITDNTHDITAYLSTGQLYVADGANAFQAVDTAGDIIGDILALNDDRFAAPHNTYPTISAIEAGTDDQQVAPVPTGARIVLAANIFFAMFGTYTAANKTLIESQIQWLLVAPPADPVGGLKSTMALRMGLTL